MDKKKTKREKKQPETSDQKVYINYCALCGKPIRTCNRNRTVCDLCCENPKKRNKKKIVQKKNKDGVSYTRECFACGHPFVTVSGERIRCSSCYCDDYNMEPAEIGSMFKMGDEPDNTMPSHLKIKCRNCSLKNTCTRWRTRGILNCPNGKWVTCDICHFAPRCEDKKTAKAKGCQKGILRLDREIPKPKQTSSTRKKEDLGCGELLESVEENP